MTKRNGKITPEKRREVIRLAARGGTYREIADTVDLHGSDRDRGQAVGGRDPPGDVGSGHETALARGPHRDQGGTRAELSLRAIARGICRDPATVCREVKANGGRRRYSRLRAHRGAAARTRRPKLTKLASNPELCARVVADLKRLWSPEQIASRLRDVFPLSSYRNSSFYMMRTDAFDRFGTSLAQRFTRHEIEEMMVKSGLERITFSPSPPHWCAVGFRTGAPS